MHVLRYRPGDRIEVTDGRGGVYTVRLRNLRGLEIEGEIEEAVYDPDEVGYELTLVVGVIKHPDRQAWLVEKATELGCVVSHGYEPVEPNAIRYVWIDCNA